MPRVLLLASTTGYQVRTFGEAAERLGVQLAFATDRCHLLDDPWRDEAIPIRFHEEDASVVAILASARARPIDGVLVVGDRPAAIGARVQQALGFPGHPPDAAAAAGNKRTTRERLRRAGLAVPWFVTTPIDTDASALAASMRYPCVVKPLALSGSRGVMRADTAKAFIESFDRLRALLRSTEIRAERLDAHETAIVERFIPGRECAVEAVLEHGSLRLLALFDKPDPLDGPFFEETIYVTPSTAPAGIQRDVVDAVTQGAAALGLRHGPIHAECRVNDAGVFVLEVAARPIGGLCARALQFTKAGSGDPGFGIRRLGPESRVPLEDLLLRHALGESLVDWIREARASGVMMIPIPRRGVLRQVDGVEDARQVPGVDDVKITAKVDQILVPLPEGASYLGFIFAHGSEPRDVERALRDAHARLAMTIDVPLAMIASA